jgi:hypothetical protein
MPSRLSALLIPPACALVGAAAPPLAAQPPLAPGARVRVFAADSLLANPPRAARGWRLGTVAAVTPRTLLLETAAPASRISLELAEVTRVDVSRGRGNRRWAGAVTGGLLTGGAFVGLACAFGNGSCRPGDDVGGFLVYYAVGAIPGALAGGALGARMRGAERWRRVWPAPPR